MTDKNHTFNDAQPTREKLQETIWGTIAAVYGELDEEDCAWIDKVWANQRGLIIAAQPPAAPVETATKSAPALLAPQNNAEALPKREPAGAGADTQCSAATGGDVSIRRDWLQHVIATMQGPLPSGRIGDVVFLLRDQLQDILDRPVTAAQPQAAPVTDGSDCAHRIAVTPRNGAPHGAGFACSLSGGHCSAKAGCGYEPSHPNSRAQSEE